MRIDRTSKTRLGLSVLASGSLLLATVGAASAHVGPGSRTVGLFGGDMRARILAMEPDLDEQEVDDLVDSVQEAIDEAAAEDDQGDQGDQAETHDSDHADGPGLGAHEREHAVEAKPEASHKHHAADESKPDGTDAKDDENENENENEDGDAEDGEHDDGDQADGDHQDGQDGGDAGGGDAGGGHESSGD